MFITIIVTALNRKLKKNNAQQNPEGSRMLVLNIDNWFCTINMTNNPQAGFSYNQTNDLLEEDTSKSQNLLTPAKQEYKEPYSKIKL